MENKLSPSNWGRFLESRLKESANVLAAHSIPEHRNARRGESCPLHGAQTAQGAVKPPTTRVPASHSSP